ncbi:MAG: glutamate-5-semialdehyde dehydrogenase [bacterium]|nr:glutamate-5-semialdehyde dehydrogenase [bacterium]
MIMKEKIEQIAKQGKKAAHTIALLSTSSKKSLLQKMADRLIDRSQEIEKINQKDLKAGEKKGLSPVLLDRLLLNKKRIQAMADGLREVATLPDPVGQTVKEWTRPNGLKISRVRIPIGLIAVIYESRPNVTVDAAGLCLKSGNAVILRGGSEAIHSNIFLATLLREVLKEEGVDPDVVQVVKETDRKAMGLLVQQHKLIDLVIPRGGEGLMQWISKNSRIPVIKHDKGICHTFVDEKANLEMALNVCFNAKVGRPGVCNAMETLLAHEKIAPVFLPKMIQKYQAAQVEIRGCRQTKKIVPGIKLAIEEDWKTEYLDLILSIRVVPTLDAALDHIRQYGSLHTEAIITEDSKTAERFLREAPSSLVLHNASTRFNDGGELGLGAEIGISTSKLHAFGPMGLEELTTLRFIAKGSGQTRK